MKKYENEKKTEMNLILLCHFHIPTTEETSSPCFAPKGLSD
jgi:hypothetical protein